MPSSDGRPRHPHAVAVRHHEQTITYGELNRWADRLAGLLARNGVRPGDDVALFVRRGIPMVAGLLAALKAGAAYVPAGPGHRPAGAAPPGHRHGGDQSDTHAV